MQKQRPPSFFQMRTTALHHGLLLGQIAPACSMSFTCVLTSSNKGGGMHLNHSIKGSSSITLILCLTWLVHPSSLSSRERHHGIPSTVHRCTLPFPWAICPGPRGPGWISIFPGVPPHQELVWDPLIPPSIPAYQVSNGLMGLHCMSTRATFWPFFKLIGEPVVLCNTMGMVLLPHLSTV